MPAWAPSSSTPARPRPSAASACPSGAASGAIRPPCSPMLDALALRAEQAGLDASAPPQQADIDGWLIRLSPGKAKRSRCINALRAGTLPLDELLARCQHAYDAAGLPLAVRVT